MRHLLGGKPPSGPEGHQNNFDALRLLLAIAVVFGHSWPIVRGVQTMDPWTHDPLFRLTFLQYNSAYVAVNCFFAISGYLIAGSWERSQSTLDFIQRRILRIYPAFVLVTLFCALIVGPLFSAQRNYWSDLSFVRLGVGVLLLSKPAIPPVFPANPFHEAAGSLWTIPYEFGCYLLIPILAYLSGERLRWVIAILAVIAVGMFWAQHFGKLSAHSDLPIIGDVWNWPRFLACFLVGATIWLFQDRIVLTRKGAIISLVILLAAMWYRQIGGVFPVFGTYLILAIGVDKWPKVSGNLRGQDWSYGTFCFSYPIQQMIVAIGAPTISSPWIVFCLALPLSFLFAAASWNFVERPALHLKAVRTPTKEVKASTCAEAPP